MTGTPTSSGKKTVLARNGQPGRISRNLYTIKQELFDRNRANQNYLCRLLLSLLSQTEFFNPVVRMTNNKTLDIGLALKVTQICKMVFKSHVQVHKTHLLTSPWRRAK